MSEATATTARQAAGNARRTPERIQFLTDLLSGAIEHSGYGFSTAIEYEPADDSTAYAVIFDRFDIPENATCERCKVRIEPVGPWDVWTATDGSRVCGEPADRHEPVRETWRVDLDTIARGLGIIRNAVMREVPNDGPVPHNKVTGERLYYGGESRKLLMQADRTNGDEGDWDVISALAVLECAIFGAVRYN